MATLTRMELARIVSERMGYSARVCLLIVDRLFDHLKNAVIQGNDVKIVRFGTFSPVAKGARKGVSPATGEPITIPPRRTVVFRPSRVLKGAVHGKASKEVLQDRRGQQPDRG